MEDLNSFIKNTSLGELGVDIEEETIDYDKRSKKIRLALLAGAGITAMGFAVSRRHRKSGEAIMVAGVLPVGLFALHNWSERERTFDMAVEKVTDAVSELANNHMAEQARAETVELEVS